MQNEDSSNISRKQGYKVAKASNEKNMVETSTAAMISLERP
jgi:hypothetical protein